MEDLLLLVHRMPYPPNKGDKVRSYHLLKHLAERYRVHLGTFIDDANDWRYVDKVRDWCGETHFAKLDPRWARVRSLRALVSGDALALPYYFDRGLARWVSSLLARVPVRRAVVFSSPMAQYVNGRDSLERIVDFVDVDSDKWIQYAQAERSGALVAPKRWLYRREGERLLEFERATAARSTASVFVTRAEAALFQRLAPESAHKTFAVENGVDLDFFSPGVELPNPYDAGVTTAAPVVVFTGAMDYWPNVDAVGWFARDILPKIRQVAPEARFYVVGARPTAEVRALAQLAGVEVTGTVDDVRPYLAHAAVAVVPTRVARGIQNKALEAMAMARPVVITRTSAAALNAAPDAEFSAADDAHEFAQCVVGLLRDRVRAEAMGRAARACVVRNYAWSANLSRLDACFQTTPKSSAASSQAAGGVAAEIAAAASLPPLTAASSHRAPPAHSFSG